MRKRRSERANERAFVHAKICGNDKYRYAFLKKHDPGVGGAVSPWIGVFSICPNGCPTANLFGVLIFTSDNSECPLPFCMEEGREGLERGAGQKYKDG